MYSVKISPAAKEDLMSTKSYLTSEFDPDTAERVIRSIMASLSKFESFPLMGRPLSNMIDVPTDYMYFVIEKNYVFYRVEDQTVRIIRILSTRRDYMKVLFGDSK